MQTKNAIIKQVRIEHDDHGMLTAWVDLDYGSSKQGFGGYFLYVPPEPESKTHGVKSFAGHFIWRVMETVGVRDWDSLIGKTIRVKADDGRIHAIGHIIYDLWFNPGEEFRTLEEKE